VLYVQFKKIGNYRYFMFNLKKLKSMSDLISADFTVENQNEVLDLILQLKSKLSFGIKLAENVKKTIPRLDDGRLPFTEKGMQFGKQIPAIVPPYTPLDEYQKDLDLYNLLGPIEKELLSLSEIIADTRTASGSDAYTAALSIYNSAKGAVKSGIPGTQTVVEEMGKLFAGQGAAKKAAMTAV
jgi:hypothetical protein